MDYFSDLLHEATLDHSLLLLAGLLLAVALARFMVSEERARLRLIAILFLLHGLMVCVAAGFLGEASNVYRDLRLTGLVFEAAASVAIADLLVFGLFLHRARVRPPRILRDVVVAGATLVSTFLLATRLGLSLTGLVATSTVLTAVVGLALQDTLGNVVGGLAIQMDKSIKVGDWIKMDEVAGRVSEIHWRYTAIETNNWETVVVPNGALIRGKIVVFGRRGGQPAQWRRWIYFNVDYRTPPSEVIRAMDQALQLGPIDHVAAHPAAHCIFFGFQDSEARYAVRYWLTDLGADDATDSVVRMKIYFALKRAEISPSIPAHATFLTEESPTRGAEKQQIESDKRLRALEKVTLFQTLSGEERAGLARGLKHVPFMKGETVIRQGSDAHWLYMMTKGEASVRIGTPDGDIEVARLSEGAFFGEGGLMTGEPRTATVVALTDVDCYRLDKATFQLLLRQRPKIAEHVADVMAQRRMEYAARENLDQETRQRRLADTRSDLLGKIRSFFGL